MQESFPSVYPEQQKSVSPVSESSASLRVSPRHRAKLQKAIHSILDPHPDHDPPFVIWIAGDPGVGKSMLIDTVCEGLGDQVQVLRALARPHTGEVLEPILTAARAAIEVILERVDEGVPGWTRFWEEVSAQRGPALDRVLPEVEWGVSFEPFPDLDPEYERNRLLDHLGGLFLQLADQVPIVLHVDGAHALDSLSRELLVTLAGVMRARSEGRRADLPLPQRPRLGVILSTDNEDDLGLNLTDTEMMPLVIGGLGRDEFGRVLKREYGEEIPLSIREKLYQKTHGNPLDLDHRMQRERRENDGNTEPAERARRLIDLGSYEEQVVAEIRSAKLEERKILHALAILEKPVSPSILCGVADVSDKRLDYLVATLADRAWVQALPNGAVGLRHSRARTPLIETMSRQDRLDFHQRAAETIAAEYEQRPYRRFQEVYYHYSQAPRGPHTVEAGFAAAEEAFRLCAYGVAMRIYDEILDLLEHDNADLVNRGICRLADLLAGHPKSDERQLRRLEQRVSEVAKDLSPDAAAGLWRRLGVIAGEWGLRKRELSYYRTGLDSLATGSRSSERMLLFACLAQTYLKRRRFDETLRYCHQGIEVSRIDQLTEDPEFLELCRVTEEVHFHRGDFVEAIQFEERFQELAQSQGKPQQVFDSLLRLAYLYENRGDHEAARDCLHDALPVARSTGSRLLEARIDERIGYLHARLEMWQEATDAFSRAFEAQAEIGNEERTIRVLGALGMVSLFMGNAIAGAHHFRLYALYQGLRKRTELPPQVPAYPCDYRSRSERDEEIRSRMEVISRTGKVSSRVLVDALSELADLRRDRGEFQTARALLRRGLRMAHAEQLEPSRFYLQLGVLHQLQGEVGSALDCLQKGLNALGQSPNRERIAESNLQVGLLYLSCGQYASALNSLIRGLRSYLELEHETGVAHAILHLAEAYRLLGRYEASEELSMSALALADALGIERLEAEAWLVLASVRRQGDGHTPGHQEVGLARELFHKLGILEGRCRALLVESEIFLHWGDSARASSLCNEALEIARDLGLRPLTARGLALRGAVEGDPNSRGDFLQALKTLEAALEHAEEVGARQLRLEVHGTLADLYHQRNRPGVARDHLQEVRRSLDALLRDCPAPYRESLSESYECSSLLRIYDLEEEELVS